MKNKLTLSSLEDTKKLGQELAKEILKRKGEAEFVVFLDIYQIQFQLIDYLIQ